MKMFNNRNHLSDQLYMFFCPLKFESDYFVNGTATACDSDFDLLYCPINPLDMGQRKRNSSDSYKKISKEKY